MKNKKNLSRSNFFLAFLFISITGIIGCSKSEDTPDIDTNCTNWSDQFLAQANAYSLASQTYANDPTLANCQNYKAAGLAYIAALEGVIDCVPTANSQGYIESLNEYRAEVNAIECN
jgi:hypothetical protein